MTAIFETAQKVEAYRRRLNASRAPRSDPEFVSLLLSFVGSRALLVTQPIGDAVDALIVANTARQAAVALIGGPEKLEPVAIRYLASDVIEALDNLRSWLETESKTTTGALGLDGHIIVN